MLTAKLLSLFAQHTYVILFLWVFCEQMGFPIPSGPLLIAAGALCALNCGAWIITFSTVVIACILADFFWYQLGRSYGHSLLSCLFRISLMSPASLIKASDRLAKYNSSTLVFAKFIPGLSTLVPPLSGHSGMGRSKFLYWDLIGSALWAFVWLMGGRLLISTLKACSHFLRIEAHAGLHVALCLVAAVVLWRVTVYLRFVLAFRKMRVSPRTLQAMISSAKDHAEVPPYVLDLRITQDVALDPRQIPNAIRVEPKSLQANHHVIPRDREVVLYCSCPGEAASTLWALRLRKLGIVKVHLLRGGFEGWLKEGYELTTRQESWQPSHAQFSVDAPLLIEREHNHSPWALGNQQQRVKAFSADLVQSETLSILTNRVNTYHFCSPSDLYMLEAEGHTVQ
jgi:membrane protein DedA with SNARE-associated domain/rhodanese-related sulfurtransferase